MRVPFQLLARSPRKKYLVRGLVVPSAVVAGALFVAGCLPVGGPTGGGPGGGPTGGPVAAPLQVTTDHGDVRGAAVQAHRVFDGIPYAAPPVGDLRWKPPAPAQAWTGTRDATKPAASCPQPAGLGSTGTTSEDCLFLNVTTPAAISTKLPVMVFLHGGGFTSGSGASYDPTPLVEKGQTVVVTPNYRLGALGFLATPALIAQGGDAGMYGIEDQQAALRWVRANITAFGGDPQNVTVFGESAGAVSSCVQLVSPSSVGLFDRVASQSGCALGGVDLQTASSRGSAIETAAGCTGAEALACMRGKTPQDLLKAIPSGALATFDAVYGGSVLPASVPTLLAQGKGSKTPLLVGTNHDEGRLLALVAGGSVDATTYPKTIQTSFGADAGAVLAEYPASAYSSPALAYATLIGDSQFSCRTLRQATSAATQRPVYQYEFDDTNVPSLIPDFLAPYPLGVTHGAELPYLFKQKTLNAAQQASSDRMIGYWTRFAATGDPNGAGASTWPAVTATDSHVLSLRSAAAQAIPTADFSTDHHCDFWQIHDTV